MTLKRIKNLPTLSHGHTDDLKIQTPVRRVWLSRVIKNEVTEEAYNFNKGRWETVKTYIAK